ncbi:hypothetical protein [Taishania pollutisoli]|nr:hypothetical protein [Taishania pollutisoli]
MVAIKPIIMTNKNLTLLFIPLMCVSNLSLSATGIKTEHQPATPNPETHFPRIEIYRVKDYGNPASEEKHPENDGTVHYMEKKSREPYIERTSYLLDSETRQTLLNQELVFLPYFMELKHPVTLRHYFNRNLLQDLPQRQELFPASLDGYTAIIQKKEIQPKTLLAYHNYPPAEVEIVWLDEKTWFVNNVFYQLSLDEVIRNAPTIVTDEKLIKGELTQFIHHSFVIQSKLNEGFAYLDTDTSHYLRKKDNVILVVAQIEKNPEATGYEYTFYADGSITTPGLSYYTPLHKISHCQWVAIQNHLNTIDFDIHKTEADDTPAFIREGQANKLYAFKNGNYYKLEYHNEFSPIPQQIVDFTQTILEFLSQLEK